MRSSPKREPVAETVPLPEVARILGIGRNSVYAAVQRGELPVIRIGGRIVMSRRALDRLLDGQTAGAA